MRNLNHNNVTQNIPKRKIGDFSVLIMSLSTVVAAVCTLFATVVAKLVLQGSQLTEFLIFWSLVFAIFTLPFGLCPEVTRAVTEEKLQSDSEIKKVRIFIVSLLFGLLLAIIVGVSSVFWGSAQLPTNTDLIIPIICVSIIVFTVQMTSNASYVGRGAKNFYAAMIAFEPLLRLLLMCLVMLCHGSILELELATLAPTGLWIIFALVFKETRRTLVARADVSAGKFVKNITISTVASIFIAVLMTGLPNLLKVSESLANEVGQETNLSILILAVLICRAPIMLPLSTIQTIAVNSFVTQKNKPLQALKKPFILMTGLGIIGGFVAYAFGPVAFKLIYPPKDFEQIAYDYVANGLVLAALVFAGALLAVMTLTGTMVLAVNKHKTYLAGWIVAAVTAVILVFLPLDLVMRTVLALYVAPVLGFLTHMFLLKRK